MTRDEISSTERYSDDGDAGSMNANGEVGPVIVARAPYAAASCTLGADETGNAVIWYHSRIKGQLDPGQGNVSTGDAAAVRRMVADRVQREQAAGRAYADRVRQFWEGQRR
jgi:hypothetical protein